MARSPDSLIPSAVGRPKAEKRGDKAPTNRRGSKANPRAATKVNAVSASSTSPASSSVQLELFPARRVPAPRAKPATTPCQASSSQRGRPDGVQGGGTRRKRTRITGESLFGPCEAAARPSIPGREAHKGSNRKRRNDAGQEVGGGHSTGDARDNRAEGRVAASTTRSKRRKTAGLLPCGAEPRSKTPREGSELVNNLWTTLYRAAKAQPQRRFPLLIDKVYRRDVLSEAWRRVKSNRGAAGVDEMCVNDVIEYGVERFLDELQDELRTDRYRVAHVRRVHIPKPGQPGKTRPLGIPTVKDRVVQTAVKLVIEPLFEANFLPCSYGFRPQRTQRMALSAILMAINAGFTHVVDVDLASYFDTIDHQLLMRLVEKRVADLQILRLIRAWLRAGVMEEGKVTHPIRGSPQGGCISPLLSNVYLHEIDRQWCSDSGDSPWPARLVRYADDMVILARTEQDARWVWQRLAAEFNELKLTVNQQKSGLTTVHQGFAFLGFEFRQPRGRALIFPRAKAQANLRQRVQQTMRSTPSSARLDDLIRKLNPIITGWCTYFRVGNSNRTFHVLDWQTRTQIQIWLRRKYGISRVSAAKRWDYRFLHGRCRLYRLVGKVSHLPGLR